MEEVRSLVAAGADVNPVYWGRPVIHIALDGCLDDEDSPGTRTGLTILGDLLDAGADIDARDKESDGTTLVMRAAGRRRSVLVKYLIERGADTRLKDRAGRTVFRRVDSENSWSYEKVKRVLVESTAGREWLHANGVDDKAPIPAVRAYVEGVLQGALKVDDSEGLKRIIGWVEAGGDLEWRSPSGWTLLHLAAQCGNERVVRFLLARGADIEAFDRANGTPLMLACTVGYMALRLSPSMVALLLNSGANPNAHDRDGDTALGRIRRSNLKEAEEIAQILIGRGTVQTSGRDSPCTECGAPYSAEMAKRGVDVPFQGAIVTFACPACNARQQVAMEQIGKAAGVRVRCACGAISLIPASVWCGACGQGLSSGWQSKILELP